MILRLLMKFNRCLGLNRLSLTLSVSDEICIKMEKKISSFKASIKYGYPFHFKETSVSEIKQYKFTKYLI